MKKVLVVLLFLISLSAISQVSPVADVRIPSATDDFGTPIPVGWTVYDNSTGKKYFCISAADATDDLTSAAAKFKEITTTGTYVTSVTATSPVISSGGYTPNISLDTAKVVLFNDTLPAGKIATNYDLRNYADSTKNPWYYNGGHTKQRDVNSKVAIGNITPTQVLSVKGNQVFTNYSVDGVANAEIASIYSQARGYTNQGANMASIQFRTNSAAWYKGEIAFLTNNTDGTDPNVAATERLRIKADGKVAIGGTAPGSTLGVYGNAAIGSNYAAQAAPSNGLIVEGNVGIGTTAPTTKLDVQGTGRFSGSLALRTLQVLTANDTVLGTNGTVGYFAPNTFAPYSHTQGWNTITGVPATYTATAHNHDHNALTNYTTRRHFTQLEIDSVSTDNVGILVAAGDGKLTGITNSSTNWDAGYNYRVTSASGTTPLTLSLGGNAISGSMTQANTSTNGWLSFTDWNTFNNKQPAGSYLTGNQTITLSGDASGSGTTAITVAVVDDLHNHVISNVDDLQTTLDAKVAKADSNKTSAGNYITNKFFHDSTFWTNNGSTVYNKNITYIQGCNETFQTDLNGWTNVYGGTVNYNQAIGGCDSMLYIFTVGASENKIEIKKDNIIAGTPVRLSLSVWASSGKTLTITDYNNTVTYVTQQLSTSCSEITYNGTMDNGLRIHIEPSDAGTFSAFFTNIKLYTSESGAVTLKGNTYLPGIAESAAEDTIIAWNPANGKLTAIPIPAAGTNYWTASGNDIYNNNSGFVKIRNLTNDGSPDTVLTVADGKLYRSVYPTGVGNGTVTSISLATSGVGLSVVGTATVTTSGTITLKNTAIDSTTVSNMGDGEGTIFKEESSNQLLLKSIKQGTGITVTNNTNDITIASTLTSNATHTGDITGATALTLEKIRGYSVVNTAPTNGQSLRYISGSWRPWADSLGSVTQGTLTGSGTSTYIPVWTSGSALGDSPIQISGTNAGIGSVSGAYRFSSSISSTNGSAGLYGTSSGATTGQLSMGVYAVATTSAGGIALGLKAEGDHYGAYGYSYSGYGLYGDSPTGWGLWSGAKAGFAKHLYLSDITPPSPTTNNLYANGGNLYWNGNKLNNQTSVSSIDSLAWKKGTASTYLRDLTDNVGIGTATPTHKLQVNGNIYTTDTLYVGPEGSKFYEIAGLSTKRIYMNAQLNTENIGTRNLTADTSIHTKAVYANIVAATSGTYTVTSIDYTIYVNPDQNATIKIPEANTMIGRILNIVVEGKEDYTTTINFSSVGDGFYGHGYSSSTGIYFTNWYGGSVTLQAMADNMWLITDIEFVSYQP